MTLQVKPSLELDTGILVKRPAGTSDIGRDCRNNTSVQQSCLARNSEDVSVGERNGVEPTVDRTGSLSSANASTPEGTGQKLPVERWYPALCLIPEDMCSDFGHERTKNTFKSTA